MAAWVGRGEDPAAQGRANSLAAAGPNGLFVEQIPQLRAVTRTELRIEDGHALAPIEPGLGIDWDRDALDNLGICQGAEVNFAADEDELARIVASRKTELAFSLGGMGSGSTNFYNDAYSRQSAGSMSSSRRWASHATRCPSACAGSWTRG